jgi:RecA-family ATPase
VSLRPSSVPEEFKKAPKPETVTAADLMAAELPPVRWGVRGVLPEGVTLLAGKPKLGKSWLALGLCAAVGAGGVALGTRQVEQGDVLYLALEDNRRRLQKRLGKMLRGPAPEGLEIAISWPKLDEGGVEALEAWLREHREARLVVVDTLAKIRPRTRGQNVYQEDYAALEELLPLAAEHEVAIVVVHHTRKMAAADPLDEISGSTGLTGGVDGVLVLKRDRGKADAVLHVDGRDIEEPAEYALK